MDSQTLSNLTELAYSKYTGHYNSKNWMANLPNWSRLSDTDKEFWLEFIKGIRLGFKTTNEAAKS